MTRRTAQKTGRRASSDGARGHHPDDRFDARGFPVTRRGELGPPGIVVRRQMPTGPHVETLATCLACRGMIAVFATADGAISGWSCSAWDRFAHETILQIFGITDAVFAPGCSGNCRGVEHFSWKSEDRP